MVRTCIAFVLTTAYNISIRKNVFLKGAIIMAAKSANLYARIEPEVKEQAERSAERILSACSFTSGSILA